MNDATAAFLLRKRRGADWGKPDLDMPELNRATRRKFDAIWRTAEYRAMTRTALALVRLFHFLFD